MRIIPVLDVRAGQAVRAIAGNRAHYGPLRSVLHEGTDPFALARAGQAAWGLADLYLADLDAILGESAPNLELYRALADLGLTLWVDSGVRDVPDVPKLVEAGVTRVIVGLETVRGPEALARIVAEVGLARVVFSLDLRDGRPLVATTADWKTDRAEEIAARAIESGVSRIIALDLARVGTGRGVESPARPLDPRAEWFVGGGIAGFDEIKALGQAGYHGVLVGSALHDGKINADMIKFQ
jgi:phosphoribosylformimino-5-aminoimidazole carboxamide ribotide isomerase